MGVVRNLTGNQAISLKQYDGEAVRKHACYVGWVRMLQHRAAPRTPLVIGICNTCC